MNLHPFLSELALDSRTRGLLRSYHVDIKEALAKIKASKVNRMESKSQGLVQGVFVSVRRNVHDFTAEPVLEGVYLSSTPGKFGKNDHIVRKADGSEVIVFGNTVLNGRMAGIKEMARIRIVYQGKKKNKAGTTEYKDFDVQEWKAAGSSSSGGASASSSSSLAVPELQSPSPVRYSASGPGSAGFREEEL